MLLVLLMAASVLAYLTGGSMGRAWTSCILESAVVCHL